MALLDEPEGGLSEWSRAGTVRRTVPLWPVSPPANRPETPGRRRREVVAASR